MLNLTGMIQKVRTAQKANMNLLVTVAPEARMNLAQKVKKKTLKILINFLVGLLVLL